MFISRPLSEGTARMYLAISSAAFPAISVRGVLAYRKTTMIVVSDSVKIRIQSYGEKQVFLNCVLGKETRTHIVSHEGEQLLRRLGKLGREGCSGVIYSKHSGE